MSTHIDQQFESTGVAQVIVVLKTAAAISGAVAASSAARGAAPVGALAPPPSAPGIAGMENYFQSSELSQASALKEAGLMNASLAMASASSRTRAAARAAPSSPVRYYPNLGVMFGTVSREGLTALRTDDRVSAVTGAPQISLIHPKRIAATKLTRQVTWGIDFLEVPRLWKQGITGKGVRVAHLDTGADGHHPALKRAIESFIEFDFFGEPVTPSPFPHDSEDHGTHTAATIAGREVRGKSIGVAPGAELASAIVIEGGEVVARVLGGMDWALSQGVKILNMSLGFRGWWEDFIPITQILRTQGVFPVIAVGNEYAGSSRSPGNYPDVISVGAHDINKAVAPFSSSQRFRRAVDPIVPDLVAPGVDIISAKPGGGYQAMDGSSMATPHVAGLAALLFEAKPDATIDEVENAIFNSCTLATGMLTSRANRGYPNAAKAFTLLTGQTLTSPKATRGGAVKGGRKKSVQAKKRSAGKGAKKSATKTLSSKKSRSNKAAKGKKSSRGAASKKVSRKK